MPAERALIVTALVAILASSDAGAQVPPPGEEAWTVDIPFDAVTEAVDCPFDPQEVDARPGPVFQYMQKGSAEASACVAFLDTHLPGWQNDSGADELVVPFVGYLEGDGTAYGLQQHAVFINLLGQLEKIAPDWRWRPEVRALMPGIILASVVADPFVADFWTTALDEMDGNWKTSTVAKSTLPELFQLAVTEQQKPLSQRNVRPRELLKELSGPEYGRLLWETEVFSTWPRRLLWILIAIALLGLAGRHILRRQKRKAPQ